MKHVHFIKTESQSTTFALGMLHCNRRWGKHIIYTKECILFCQVNFVLLHYEYWGVRGTRESLGYKKIKLVSKGKRYNYKHNLLWMLRPQASVSWQRCGSSTSDLVPPAWGWPLSRENCILTLTLMIWILGLNAFFQYGQHWVGLRARVDFFDYHPRNEKGIRKFYRIHSLLFLN